MGGTVSTICYKPGKAVETAHGEGRLTNTGLKPGVNETRLIIPLLQSFNSADGTKPAYRGENWKQNVDARVCLAISQGSPYLN